MLSPFTFINFTAGEGGCLTAAEFLFDHDVCGWCHSSPQAHGDSESRRLKRCRGCDATVYCGKECQAAAWSRHRLLCYSGSLQPGQNASFAGFSTAIGLGEAVGDWIRIHKYTLMVIVHSIVRRGGGVEAAIRQGRAVIFDLLSRQATNPRPAHEDPAVSFRIRFTKFAEVGHVPTLASPEYVQQPRPTRESEEGGFRGGSVSVSATPVGFVPVVFMVLGTEFSVAANCTLYRRASRDPDDAPVDEETLAAFEDLGTVFVNFIQHGIVLRPPVNDLAPDPEVGEMMPVRGRRRWQWRRREHPWRIIDSIIAIESTPLNMSLPSRSLWTHFLEW